MKKLFALFALPLFLMPLTSFALLGVPFGGRVLSTVPCPCSGGMLITFAPLYTVGLGSMPFTSTLYYTPAAAIPYPYPTPGVPSSWEWGSFTPGSPVCLVPLPTTPPSCGPVPLPIPMGTIREFASSLPVFK